MNALRALLFAAVLAVLPVGLHAGSHHHAHATPKAPFSPLAASGTGRGLAAAIDDAAADDLRRAQDALDKLKLAYRYLEDVSVRLGATPHGEEAVAYYTEGEIVIDRNHSVDVNAILAHEVWHIIDWRDNGRLDWGEQLPPSGTDTYVR